MRALLQANNQTLSRRRGRQNTMKARLFFAFYAFLCATFLFNICSCATVPIETALKLKDFHAEETKAFGNGDLTGESDNPVKGDNNDDDEDEGEWAEENNEGEEDFEDFDDDDEHADGENNEYDDDEDRLIDEKYAIEDEEDADDPKQLSNVSDDDDDDDSPEETAITEKTLELANADRKGILTPLQFEIIE